jgi:hypothetical protein
MNTDRTVGGRWDPALDRLDGALETSTPDSTGHDEKKLYRAADPASASPAASWSARSNQVVLVSTVGEDHHVVGVPCRPSRGRHVRREDRVVKSRPGLAHRELVGAPSRRCLCAASGGLSQQRQIVARRINSEPNSQKISSNHRADLMSSRVPLRTTSINGASDQEPPSTSIRRRRHDEHRRPAVFENCRPKASSTLRSHVGGAASLRPLGRSGWPVGRRRPPGKASSDSPGERGRHALQRPSTPGPRRPPRWAARYSA